MLGLGLAELGFGRLGLRGSAGLGLPWLGLGLAC